jgi:hypothetical protein
MHPTIGGEINLTEELILTGSHVWLPVPKTSGPYRTLRHITVLYELDGKSLRSPIPHTRALQRSAPC